MKTPNRSGGAARDEPLLHVPERYPGSRSRPTTSQAFQDDLDSDDDVDAGYNARMRGARGVVTPAAPAIARPPVVIATRSDKTSLAQLQARETPSASSPNVSSSRAPSSAVAGAARLATSEASSSPTVLAPPSVVVVETPVEEVDPDKPNNWSTSLFTDACIDTALAFEVCLCHPCNVAAQYEAALRKTPEPPEFKHDSDSDDERSSSSEEKPQQKIVRRKGSRPRDDSSSDTADEAEVALDMDKLRESLPPLDIIPCVGVIVLDVMCWGAGSAFFTYWIRNEVARRFNIIPDAAEQIKEGVRRAKELKEKAVEQSKKLKTKAKAFHAEISENPDGQRQHQDDGEYEEEGVEEYEEGEEHQHHEEEEYYEEEEEQQHDEEHAAEDEAYPGAVTNNPQEKESFFSRLRRRMQPRLEMVKRGAVKIGKAAQKQATKAASKTTQVVAKHAEKATYVGADYAQSSLASCFCFPCALCQTHRELEKHGLPPTRYLSATRLAAAYATGSLAGNSKLAKRML